MLVYQKQISLWHQDFNKYKEEMSMLHAVTIEILTSRKLDHIIPEVINSIQKEFWLLY